MMEIVHDMGHRLTHYISSDAHWWVHFVFHLVVFGVPVALTIILSAAGYRIIKRRKTIRSWRSQRSTSKSETALLQYIFRASWKRQLKLGLLAAASLPALYMSLELPKLIINNAIESGHFPIAYLGMEFSQTMALFALCLLFLLAIGVHGGLKYQVNLQSGALAEHISRRLRLDISKFSLRKPSRRGGVLIPVIVQEVEPVAGYAAESIVLPLLQGGTFLTILTFMLAQDLVLGIAATALLPLQIFVIPRFQKKINALSRTRLKEVRVLGEKVANISNDKQPAAQDIYGSYKRLHDLRLSIHKNKFAMKSLNNFISQMTPFFFYTIGGYLVIKGDLTLGALIAVLTAYKDMGAPLKELFRYYQAQADAHVRYAEIKPYISKEVEITDSRFADIALLSEVG
ncbi:MULTISPECIES: ABC transporter ATP-binding protein [Thalassospira]|uniref:ABC transporter ATP-binding protein n=1 Tax=Thalassospira TaxID=168934 RepID=UPI0007A3D27D|nr:MULTISPECIES: ABC transporter ATP-binding protein [Thalassospira]KZB70797.1 hypothetical protein AUQ43_07995 [Thalassospira sp. MCCC 1A01148]